MAGNAGLKLTVWADDKASQTFKAVGKEAARMGKGFSKSASALRLVGDAAGQMGGGIADAAGKATMLAGVIGSGGPFGLALAALTAGLAAAAFVYRSVTAESRAAEKAHEAGAKVVAAAAARIEDYRKKLAELEKQIRDVGKTQAQASAAEMQAEIDRRAFGLKLLEQEIEQRKARSDAMREEIAALSVVRGGEIVSGEAGVRRIAQLEETIKSEESLLRIQESGFLSSQKTVIQLLAQVDAYKRLDGAQKQEKKAKEENAKAERELEAAAKKRGRAMEEAWRRGIKGATEEYQRKLDLDQKLAEFQASKAEEREQMFASVADASIGAASMIGAAAISGSATEQEAARSAAVTSIGAALASGAAKAIEAHAGIPAPWGQILGVAAAAAITLAIKGMTAQYGFARGGRVSGPGGPTSDSIPIRVSSGETIVPAGLSDQLARVFTSNGPVSGGAGGFASGGRVNRGGGGNVTIVNEFRSVMPPNSLDTRRAVRVIERHAKTMRSRMAVA